MVEYNKQIADIEAEISKTKYNKAMQHHIGEGIKVHFSDSDYTRFGLVCQG